MKNLVILYSVLLVIIVGIIAYSWIIMTIAKKRKAAGDDKRRRWGRIKVPADKTMTCRITEPADLARPHDFTIDDINMGGIAFYAETPIEKKDVCLSIKFPFTTYQEAGIVRGKIVYCLETGEKKYRIGIKFIRDRKK